MRAAGVQRQLPGLALAHIARFKLEGLPLEKTQLLRY